MIHWQPEPRTTHPFSTQPDVFGPAPPVSYAPDPAKVRTEPRQ